MKKRFGSVYANGISVSPGTGYNGATITLGNTAPRKGILWNGLRDGSFIAAQCLCSGISWQGLYKMGLVYGTVVHIDGTPYLCRCLKGSPEKGKHGEWGNALMEIGEDDSDWHWNSRYAWTQEAADNLPGYRMVCGYHAANGQSWYSEETEDKEIGFRPVLEPLIPAPQSYDSLIGTKIAPLGTNGTILRGRLISYTDYDLVMDPIEPLPPDNKWAIQDGSCIIIDRASVRWLRGK